MTAPKPSWPSWSLVFQSVSALTSDIATGSIDIPFAAHIVEVWVWGGTGGRNTGTGTAPVAANAYSKSFTEQTTVSILASEHRLGTANVLVGCYDASTPALRVGPNTVSVDPATYDVVVTFALPQSGRCVVSGGSSTQSFACPARRIYTGSSGVQITRVRSGAADAAVLSGVLAIPNSAARGTRRAPEPRRQPHASPGIRLKRVETP